MSVENLTAFLNKLQITSTDSQNNPSQNNLVQTSSNLESTISSHYQLLTGNTTMAFKAEYLNCVPTFDGNPNDLNRYLSTCDSIITNFYDHTNPNKFENIYLINCLIGKLAGTAKIVVNIQNVTTWNDLKATLQRNFADQRDEACLNRDLVMLRQQPNERPNEYYDKILHILNLLCSYVDSHEDTIAAKALKRNLYSELALKTFLSGLREPLGTNIRCMRPNSLAEALQFVTQEYNNQYFQNSVRNTISKPGIPKHNFNANNFPQPKFVTHSNNTSNDFFRRQNIFPSQPINIQPRQNMPPQKFFTNSQVFGRPQNQNRNVFRPNQQSNFPKGTPMSISTRQTSNNLKSYPPNMSMTRNNNSPNMPSTSRPNFFAQTQPRNFISEELYNTEVDQFDLPEGYSEGTEQYYDSNYVTAECPDPPQYQNCEPEVEIDQEDTPENFSSQPLQDTIT